MAWATTFDTVNNPWLSDDFLMLTGVQVPPLFESGEITPTGMDPKSVPVVKEYLERIRTKRRSMKIKGLEQWVASESLDGREEYKKWWTKIWNKCKGNEKVDKFLKDNGWGAVDVWRDSNFERPPRPTDIPGAGDAVAFLIFGTERSTNPRHGGIVKDYRTLGEFIQERSYERVGRVVKRHRDKLDDQFAQLEKDVEGASHRFASFFHILKWFQR
jgi:hypothetical protein